MSAIVILTWAFERKSDIFRAEVEDNDDCEMESDNRELNASHSYWTFRLGLMWILSDK